MNPIYKHSSIQGRPEFSNIETKRERTTESMLGKNPLLRKKSTSKFSHFFKQAWINFTKYFVVQNPNPVQENRAALIRPITNEFSIGNLWDHFKPYITKDRECPHGIKACFEKMEKDEKDLIKLLKEDSKKFDQKKLAFITKKKREIESLAVGKTQVLLLNRLDSSDHSLSGDLFCTIHRHQKGYTLRFHGLEENALELEGKKKGPRALVFEDIPVDFFKNDPFLNKLLTEWIDGIDPEKIRDLTENFNAYEKQGLTLDDYNTKSSRVDKLFWNIVSSIDSTTSRDAIRGLRLRAELLTLYEAFDEARHDLDPLSAEYKDLKQLQREVSRKVLTYYKKGYLTKEDFKRLKRKLVTIDSALQKAKHPHKLPSKLSLKEPIFKDVSLKNSHLRKPETASNQLPIFGKVQPIDEEVLVLPLNEPIPLERYTGIDSPEVFMEHLTDVYHSNDRDKIVRFFYEIPFTNFTLNKQEKNPDCFWWQLDKEDALKAMPMILEMTTRLANEPFDTFTPYDEFALLKMEECMGLLNGIAYGIYLSVYRQGSSKPLYYVNYLREGKVFRRPSHEWNHLFEYYSFDIWEYDKLENLVAAGVNKKELRNLPKKSYEFLLKQDKQLHRIFSQDENYVRSYRITWENKIIRPIKNPYLIALYREITDPNFEAIFDAPEVTFQDYLHEYTDDPSPLNFTPSEIKFLSRLLRDEDPEAEFLAFMKESPHLLQNPEIRSFFDALFFQARLNFLPTTPAGIEEEIQALTAQIEEQMETAIEDPVLLKNRYELLLYYHEMLIRLREVFLLNEASMDQFLEQEIRLKNLTLWCKEVPELKGSFGYSARVYLRELLSQKPLQDKLGDILNVYSDVFGSSVDPMNVEPFFEQEMRQHWEMIALKLKDFSEEDFTPLLNRLAINKQVPLDESPWVHEGDLVFNNDQYVIDLKTWSLKFIDGSAYIGTLPPDLISAFSLKDNFSQIQVIIEKVKDSTIYSYTDDKGIPTQIQVHRGISRIYKKINNAWLQPINLRSNPRKNSLYAQFKELSSKPQVKLFDQGLFIDPSKPNKAYKVNEKGDVLFEVRLKSTSDGLTITKVYDLRGHQRNGPWNVATVASIKNKAISALTCFERNDEILLWSQKGRLKKIELPRYGLSFNEQLECLTPPYTGYRVDLNATNEEKNGIEHALLLIAPSEKLHNQLLVPDADALRVKEQTLHAKAKGFAKIALAYQFLTHQTKSIERSTVIFKKSPSHISYTAFDLRPFTNQICKGSPRDYFQLVRHAEDPRLAYFYLKKISFKKAVKDQKLIQEMIHYLHEDKSAALKVRLATKLLRTLEEQHRLDPSLEKTLENIIERARQETLEEGRRVPAQLQLLKKVKAAIPLEEQIENLEALLQPSIPLPDLKTGIKLTSHQEPICFTKDQVKKLFSTVKNELPELPLERKADESPFEAIALDEFQKNLDEYRIQEEKREHYALNTRKLSRFIKKELMPEQAKQEALIHEYRLKLEEALRKVNSSVKQMQILSGEYVPPTIDEVTLALVQGDETFKDLLIPYYDAISKMNAYSAALSLMQTMKKTKVKRGKDWNLNSDELHRLLTLERRYDPHNDPRLLVFEALTFKNFKNLPGGLNQLELLEALLGDARNLIQAPTGAGKTSVLSVLESLLKASGENLVIQKVLPPLFNQTEMQVKDVLGGLFGTLVMPLRINMKMPMTRNEIHGEETIQASVFKGMYEELLEVMQNKGVVLTDYTSFPMLEAKFFKLGLEISDQKPTDLQKEHYNYLRKILILLQNKGLESMDEFDQPNQPVQKIQLDLGVGSKTIPTFIIDTTLEIYDILLDDPELGLAANIQGDLAKETRQQAIAQAAKKMAEQFNIPNLEAYFLGENEEALPEVEALPLELQDKIAVCKDQFSIYLPLTLNANEGSKYTRSLDGSKTVPCQMGEPRENSKSGTLIENLNYTVQDYFQAGITAYDVNLWFKEFKTEWDTSKDRTHLEEEFEELFPDLTVYEFDPASAVDSINHDRDKVRKFLILRLQALKTSGTVISLDPLNAIDISAASSGISATMRAPDSMHSQFKINREITGQINAAMAYRIQGRALDSQVLAYDPAHPEAVLKDLKSPVQAIIDGSGAFRGSSQAGANYLLQANSNLKQVGYHVEGEIVFEGNASGRLFETGFFFSQGQTRGTDITLSSRAHALLTISEKDGMRDYAQKEGRLRKEGQTYQLAMPKDQAVPTVLSAMRQAIAVDALVDSKDIYRHYRQVFPAIVRKAMKAQLLACEEVEDFLELFSKEEVLDLFITQPENDYHKPGSYYKARKQIQKEDLDPQVALDALRIKYRDIAENLGLDSTALDTYTYPDGIFEKMPVKVSAMQGELENELQVEQEEETEVEAELEVQQNLEVEEAQSKDTIYPRRQSSSKKTTASIIHPAYDPNLFVSEAFLPFERNKTLCPFKRYAFEPSMFNVGEVLIQIKKGKISAVIEDPERDSSMLRDTDFIYDIRTDRVNIEKHVKRYDYWRVKKQKQKYLNQDLKPPDEKWVNSPEFFRLIAQAKFLDGRTGGYSAEELIELENWLQDSGPLEMQRHFREDILRFRYREKNRFDKGDSQLGTLFKDLIV